MLKWRQLSTVQASDAIDVHMSDLLTGRTGLEDFHALVACGGFSYGDVLGAGEGWAKSILFNDRVRDEFATFFHCPQTLALGVCNGCQMMFNLRELIPGSELWPRFVRNTSDRFEARFSLVEVTQSPSLLLQGMVASQMPIAVSHGEGRVEVRDAAHLAALESKGLVASRYVDNFGKVTETYPANPNGSPNGITSIADQSGRAHHYDAYWNVFSVLSATPGIRKTGARMAHGCAFSAMRVSSWGKSSVHWFLQPGCGIYAASGIKHQPLS